MLSGATESSAVSPTSHPEDQSFVRNYQGWANGGALIDEGLRLERRIAARRVYQFIGRNYQAGLPEATHPFSYEESG
jgi:hypothetical protein